MANGGTGKKYSTLSEYIAKAAAATADAVRNAAALKSVVVIEPVVFFPADKHSFSRSKGFVAETIMVYITVVMTILSVVILPVVMSSVVVMLVTTTKKHINTPFAVHYIIHKK